MSNIPVQYLIDQIKELRLETRQGLDKVEEKMEQGLAKVEDRLSGNDGVIERLTTLEVEMRQTRQDINASPLSTYPPPAKPKKKSIKDHAPALVAGGGSAGLLYAFIEMVNTFLKH